MISVDRCTDKTRVISVDRCMKMRRAISGEREREREVVGISVVRCTEIWSSPLMA